MKEFAATETWKKYTEIRERFQQTNKINIRFLMKQLNHSHGVRYQRMHGCGWDYMTGHIHGFDEYSYDGEDFISLDLEELRYTASVPEAIPTEQKWNKDREQLVYLKQYYRDKCTDWIYFLMSRKGDFERRGPTKTYFKILVDVIFVLIVILVVLIVLYIGTAFLVWKMKSGYQPVSLFESEIYINKGL
ncbi:major histocompatibility complex class I-related gene protein-like [Sinocyclocheilus rhinocerous]|uniref:major histocompatibility complex class I-related gene protein-like n=1 Tax=Sinocyclocheilus rhinocerous TaxID=307959 RepID=UPI0007B8A3C8|nr:PREDICTED: major histocompatibility complex class I-related gene protein-like [Sinocyclocheilus rhinocerous]